MAIGTMEVLLVTAKGLGDTDFFGTIYLYIYIYTYIRESFSISLPLVFPVSIPLTYLWRSKLDI
jgi:hypothetical protein